MSKNIKTQKATNNTSNGVEKFPSGLSNKYTCGGAMSGNCPF